MTSLDHHRSDGPVQSPESARGGSDSNGAGHSGIRVIRLDRNPRGPVLDSFESEHEMTVEDSNSMDDEAVCKRYVVLVAPGEQLPPPLMELLADRADSSSTTNVFEADHPLLGMALLAKLEGERRLQQKWELDEQTVLVVVNRDSWPDLSALFDATRELMPAVAIWVCAERIAIQIYAGEPGNDGTSEDGVDDDIHDPPSTASPIPEPEPERTSLSADELQDLLSAFDDFEDDDEATDEGDESR